MLSCFFEWAWECSSLEWVCWVTQAVLCPHMLTSQIAEHSWDRLEPESACSCLCEHENRGWGRRLQTKDGVHSLVSCGTELHSQSWRRSHEPSCPFSEKAHIFTLSSPQLYFSPLTATICPETSSVTWLLWSCFLFSQETKMFTPLQSRLSFSSALQRQTRSTFTTNCLYQWKRKKKQASAFSCFWVERWIMCLFRHARSPQEDWKIRGGLA